MSKKWVLDIELFVGQLRDNRLPQVSIGSMANVVPKGQGLTQLLVQPTEPCDQKRSGCNFLSMLRPATDMRWRTIEDLRLKAKPSARLAIPECD